MYSDSHDLCVRALTNCEDCNPPCKNQEIIASGGMCATGMYNGYDQPEDHTLGEFTISDGVPVRSTCPHAERS